MTRRSDPEAGSATVEAVIGVPVFLVLVSVIILGGRLAIAHQVVQSAAADAARAASIARTHYEARADASAAAHSSLDNQGLECASTAVTVDTSAFASRVGTDAMVTASVSCGVNLSDLGIPGLSGTRNVTASMSSPLDTYRER